ncbi:kinesin-like protein costa [Anopheles albimanus]|nr:kinesin-like protein costa [Anopheles albimanus]
MNVPVKVVVRFAPTAPRRHQEEQEDNRTSALLPADPTRPEPDHQEIDENCVRCGEGRTFRFSHVLRYGIGNQELYFESIAGFMESVLEGYDFSVVTYGAKGTGKTYTLYGGSGSPGGTVSIGDEGIVLCFVRDLFCRLNAHPERVFSISIAWSEITAEGDVLDVLENAAMVQCFSVEDTYALLGLGMHRRNAENHSILSLVLEQQWTSIGGMNQHRQSTVSFCDLRGTERKLVDEEAYPMDGGLRKLEDIVIRRSDQYNDSVLTAFLKDSFGGRAQTLLFLCVDTTQLDAKATMRDLEFGEHAEEIVNNVVMNTFSDNNVPVVPLNEDLGGGNVANLDGLYFASQQWVKLLKNAESLFTKLFSTCELNQTERSQIEEWLYLKAECDDCFSSSDMSLPTGTQPSARMCLGPIEEIDEAEDTTLQSSGKEQFQSDNESDSDLCTHLTDVSERIQSYIKTFQTKTNQLITDKYQEFFQTHPPAVPAGDSGEHEEKEATAPTAADSAPKTFGHNPARRKSIFDGDTVSSNELALILPLKGESQPIASALDKKLDTLGSNLRICQASIESFHAQIEEVRRTITLKQKYIDDLIENSETRSVAKSRFSKKKHKLEAEYEKTKKQLRKAVVNGTDKDEINRLKSHTSHLEQRLKDLESIGFIAGEAGHKKKKLQQSIKDSQKQLEVLQRLLKKELDRREGLEKELEAVQKEARTLRSGNAGGTLELNESRSKIRNMNERISHIEHVLKEKSSNLKRYVNKRSAEKESLRCEIRNLRRTRDHLVEQRCQLDRKLREDKRPSFDEERKLVECDEAIEAIDAAIEMKNELICGRRSIDTDESLQREKGEQMLMARLNKLSPDEMRTLLYKYFQKVVDLKEASRKLELQFISLEREKDAWEWQEKILTNTIRQTRLEKERSIVALQKQHETKLNLMLRHFAADTSASISSTLPDGTLPPYHTQTAEFVLGSGAARYHHINHVQYDTDGQSAVEIPALRAGHTTKQLAHYKATSGTAALPVAAGSGGTALRGTAPALEPAPPAVIVVEKDQRPKNKLFSKLQVLSRYHGSDKRKIFQSDIPQQNLKQLQVASRPSLTKVTREKNKIIIQSDGGTSSK